MEKKKVINMKDSIKILQAMFIVEASEEKANQQIFLEDIIKISDGLLLTKPFPFADNKLLLIKKFEEEPLETRFSTYEEITKGMENLEEVTPIKSRKTKKEEIELINKYYNKNTPEHENIPADISSLTFSSFDVSDSHVVVFMYGCQIDKLESGKKFVNTYVNKYSIKHGIVFEYDEDQDIDDFDEDISEIQDLL